MIRRNRTAAWLGLVCLSAAGLGWDALPRMVLMCLGDAGASSWAARLCSELGTVMPKALVVLGVSSFLVAANESAGRQQETWLLRELQVESNFLHKEKQLN